jgi:cytochrome b561
MGEAWLADSLAAVMLATAAYCLARLVTSWRQGRRTDRPVDAAHVLMGVAMAGMLVPRLRIFWTGGWEIVFAVGAVGFAGLALRELRTPKSQCDRPRHHHLQHVLACAAMVYMLAAVTSAAKAGGSGMAGMAGGAAHFPTLALVLALALLGYVIWTADRLTSLAPVRALAAASGPVIGLAPVGAGGELGLAQPDALPATAAPDPVRQAPLSPRLAACCEIAMGVTMGYMLILML